MKRNDLDEAACKAKRGAVLLATVAAIGAVAFIFLMFCLIELFINIFTGGNGTGNPGAARAGNRYGR